MWVHMRGDSRPAESNQRHDREQPEVAEGCAWDGFAFGVIHAPLYNMGGSFRHERPQQSHYPEGIMEPHDIA